MFDNKFLKAGKDPLIEAVQNAMVDGELRRKAEALVNEEFGVYNRRALVREQLAAYDARIEEAYKCMKEGKPLDPVGKEDSDVDNDGDSDKSDKYLLNRRAVRSKAIKEDDDLDEAKATTSKGVPKKYAHGLAGYHLNKMDDDVYDSDKAARKADRDQKALKSTVTKKYGKDAAGHANAVAFRYARAAVAHARPYFMPGDEPRKEVDYQRTAAVRHGDAAARASERSGKRNIKEGSAFAGKNPFDPKDPSVQGGGDVTSDAPKHVKPSNPDRIKNMKDPRDPSVQGSGDVTMKESRLDEVSRKTLVSYIRKASKSKATPENISKRTKGMEMAAKRMEEETLEELSKETKSRYIEKAMEKAKEHREKGYTKGWKPKKGAKAEDEREKMNKRTSGIEKAGKDLDEGYHQIDEVTPPGAKYERMVKHIKKSYAKDGLTSKEKSIAYATAWKAKKKHVKEDSSFNSALETGKPVVAEMKSSWADFFNYGPAAFKELSKQKVQQATKPAAKAPTETKPAVTPSPAKEPAAGTAKPASMTFSQAYAKAREAAKAKGLDPNKAQFSWTNPKGETKSFQAAATKKDYVPSSKQTKVDIGSTTDSSKKAEPASSSSLPSLAQSDKAPSTSMKLPSDLAGRNQEADKATADVSGRGIRNRSASTGEVDPTKFPAPGSAGSTTGRATSVPQATSSAVASMASTVATGSVATNPDSSKPAAPAPAPAPKPASSQKNEPVNVEESFAIVGDAKYRII